MNSSSNSFKFNKKLTLMIILIFLIIGCYAFIYGNSVQPAVESSEISTSLLSEIASIINIPWLDEHILRKIAHFSEFAGLGFLLTALFKYDRPIKKFLMLPVPFIGLLSALVDETIQLFVVGRSAQVGDIWIDFGGILIGEAILLLFSVIYSRITKIIHAG